MLITLFQNSKNVEIIFIKKYKKLYFLLNFIIDAKNYKNYDEYAIDLLKKLDKNKNGFIEFEELASGLK